MAMCLRYLPAFQEMPTFFLNSLKTFPTTSKQIPARQLQFFSDM
jgi:hypothetical protein